MGQSLLSYKIHISLAYGTIKAAGVSINLWKNPGGEKSVAVNHELDSIY